MSAAPWLRVLLLCHVPSYCQIPNELSFIPNASMLKNHKQFCTSQVSKEKSHQKKKNQNQSNYTRAYLSNSSMQHNPPSAKTRAPASNIHSPKDSINWCSSQYNQLRGADPCMFKFVINNMCGKRGELLCNSLSCSQVQNLIQR